MNFAEMSMNPTWGPPPQHPTASRSMGQPCQLETAHPEIRPNNQHEQNMTRWMGPGRIVINGVKRGPYKWPLLSIYYNAYN